MQLILASASPQRRDLLIAAGYRFTINPVGVPEVTEGEPSEVARLNAVIKAEAAAAAIGDPEAVVLGADTVVALGGETFGKPADELEALAMLSRLSGRDHLVHTGVAVVHGGETVDAVETTTVAFRDVDEPGLVAHVALAEWRDRAGGYAIQESGIDLVRSLDGELDNVIGLPLGIVASLLPGAVQPQSGG